MTNLEESWKYIRKNCSFLKTKRSELPARPLPDVHVHFPWSRTHSRVTVIPVTTRQRLAPSACHPLSCGPGRSSACCLWNVFSSRGIQARAALGWLVASRVSPWVWDGSVFDFWLWRLWGPYHPASKSRLGAGLGVGARRPFLPRPVRGTRFPVSPLMWFPFITWWPWCQPGSLWKLSPSLFATS